MTTTRTKETKIKEKKDEELLFLVTALYRKLSSLKASALGGCAEGRRFEACSDQRLENTSLPPATIFLWESLPFTPLSSLCFHTSQDTFCFFFSLGQPYEIAES